MCGEKRARTIPDLLLRTDKRNGPDGRPFHAAALKKNLSCPELGQPTKTCVESTCGTRGWLLVSKLEGDQEDRKIGLISGCSTLLNHPTPGRLTLFPPGRMATDTAHRAVSDELKGQL